METKNTREVILLETIRELLNIAETLAKATSSMKEHLEELARPVNEE